MKKYIIVAFLALNFGSLCAQQSISFGPNAGFGFTWITGNGTHKYQPAVNFGASFIYSANSHLGVGADLKYSVEGGKTEIDNATYTTGLNYVRVPLKAIFFFREDGDRVRPKISFGPSFGLLAGGKQKSGQIENRSTDAFKTFDFGFLTTAGMHVRLIANTWLTLDMNYYHGVSDISETTTFKNKNRNLQMNVGLAVGIDKSRY